MSWVCVNINNSSRSGFLTFLRTARPLGISPNLGECLEQCNKSMFLAQIILNVLSKSRLLSSLWLWNLPFCVLIRNFYLQVCAIWFIEQLKYRLCETKKPIFFPWLIMLPYSPFPQGVTLINSIKACHISFILNGLCIISFTQKKLLLVKMMFNISWLSCRLSELTYPLKSSLSARFTFGWFHWPKRVLCLIWLSGVLTLLPEILKHKK